MNEVAERLADRGHDVHLYARKAEDIDLTKVKWHRIPGPGWPEVVDFSTYHVIANRVIPSRGFDIVHSIGCNTLRGNVITIQNVQPAKRIILERLSSDENISASRRFTRWLYLKATSRAERILYTRQGASGRPMFLPVSKGVERELRAHYDIGSADVRIIPNGTDTEVFKPLSNERRRQWRLENGLTEMDVVIVFSGGEWARKGLDLAIQAVGLIRVEKVKLFVVGDDPDRARFAALAKDCGVADRVIFGGFREDVAQVLGAGDIFLLPSRYEAFSLATIEAAACGLPVLVPAISGADELIQPGKTGEFIVYDPASIATTLESLLGNRELMRAIGRAAKSRVEREYTWERVAQKTEAAYLFYRSKVRETSRMNCHRNEGHNSTSMVRKASLNA